MPSDQWFAVTRQRGSSLVYIVTGGDRRMVEAVAKDMFRSPVIVKLTWAMMKAITGCHIPGDKLTTDFCRGQIKLPRRDTIDIVIKAL